MSWLDNITSAFRRRKRSSDSTALAVARHRTMSVKLSPSDLLPNRLTDKAMWSKFSSESAMKRGLYLSDWVYTCIHKIARAFGSIELQAGTMADGEFEWQPESPLQRILNSPNEKQSASTWRQIVALEMLLTGNSVSVVTRPGGPGSTKGEPLELWQLRPQSIAPVPSRRDFISAYVVKNGKEEMRVDAKNAVHCMLPDPLDPFWGLSPMKAAARAVDIDTETAEWQKTSLQNMLVPPGVFTVKHHINEDQWEKYKERLQDRYSDAINARTPMLLGGEVDWKQLSLAPQELDFLNSGKLNAERICAIFGVPLPIAGILDRATYNNISELRAVFWNDTVIPFADFVSDTLTLFAHREYGDEWVVRPNVKRVEALLPVVERKTAIVKELWSMGVPFNRASQEVGLGIDIGEPGDVSYVPVGVQPSDEMNAFEPTPTERSRFRVIGDG